jgi:HEAT repeat protein
VFASIYAATGSACKPSRSGDSSLRLSLEALGSGDRGARLTAMSDLAQLGDDRAIDPLLRVYRSSTEEPIVREVAIVSIAELGDRHVFDYVMEQLPAALERERRGDGLSGVRSFMLGKAVLSVGVATLPRMIELTRHRDPLWRDWAITNLGFYRRESDSLRVLLELMKSPEARVRRLAASALGQLFRPEAAPALRAALADPDPSVRDSAAFSLRNVNAIVPDAAARDGAANEQLR